RPAALAAAPRRGGDPAVLAGVHARPPAAALLSHPNPRSDPRGGRPGDHVVGAVEPAQRVPARVIAPEKERQRGSGARTLQLHSRGASAIPGCHSVMYPVRADAATL